MDFLIIVTKEENVSKMKSTKPALYDMKANEIEDCSTNIYSFV